MVPCPLSAEPEMAGRVHPVGPTGAVQLVGWVVVVTAGRQIAQDTVVAVPPVTVAEYCSVPFETTVAVAPDVTPAADTTTPIAVEFPPHPATKAARSSTAPRLQTFMSSPLPLPLDSLGALSGAFHEPTRPSPLEGPAHRETEGALRLKQTWRDRLGRLQLLEERFQSWHNLRIEHTQLLQGVLDRLAKVIGAERRDNRVIQPQVVVCVVETERSVHDRKKDDKLDTRRGMGPKICAHGNRQIGRYVQMRKIPVRKLLVERREGGRVESQLRLPQNAVEAEIIEQVHAHGAGDRDAIFEVHHAL